MPRTPAPLVIAFLLALAGASPAQDRKPEINPDRIVPLDPTKTPEPETPAPILLGRRIAALKQAAEQVNTVVIVSDADSYLAAISAWRPNKRFPVLIDDGSPSSREAIARFVRGYQPKSVVRWTAPAKPDAPKPIVGADGFGKIDLTKYAAAVQAAWSVEKPSIDQTALLDTWRAGGHVPPGVVVTSSGDAAWAGGLALAAAYGQPTLFVPPAAGNIDWQMSPSEADTLEKTIESGCELMKWRWNALSDEIEAVTISLNCAERIAKTNNEFLALSDRIGRPGTGMEIKERWAWAGHIFGTASETVYMAMCSLFMSPRNAWIFDGYPDSVPWSNYDGTKTQEIIKPSGIKVELLDKPNGSAHAWRVRASRVVDAGLIFVNTKGNQDFFDLEPGQCKPGDVPMLNVPAALHLVHSWSLLFPSKRDLLGGRWRERGVFAYAGSVHEPFLHAFVPTPNAAGRFLTGAPFGASMRVDGMHMWKIAILADPLYSFTPGMKRGSESLPLEGTEPVGGNLRELLTADKFEEGINLMTLLGRDQDIAKLAAALLDSKPDKITSGVARACILPCIRAGKGELVVRLYPSLSQDAAKDGVMRDALWLTTYPALEHPADETMLNLLKANIRPDQVERDAKTLGAAWRAKFGATAAAQLFKDLQGRFTEKSQRDGLEKASTDSSPWGR